jgi:hypothetical protein
MRAPWIAAACFACASAANEGGDAAVAGQADAAPGTPDATRPDAPGGCAPAAFSYGQDCACADQCVTDQCAPAGAGGAQVCTRTCGTSQDCPGRDICSKWIQSGSLLCATNDTGDPCNDQSPCADHMCLLKPSSSTGGICTVQCTSTSKCPEGYGCLLVTPGNPNDKVCMPVGNPCPGGPNQCYTASCLVVGATGDQYCTGYCQFQSDCPVGYMCAPLNPGDTNYVCRL